VQDAIWGGADDIPEASRPFLKHFDVTVQGSGVVAEDSAPGAYLRFYYTDFLNEDKNKFHARPRPVQTRTPCNASLRALRHAA
jgi:hypothetical protein